MLLMEPETAEELVDVPTVVSFSSLQQYTAEQIVDIPVPRGRWGGGGGLQSFSQYRIQAPSQQIVDFPVRSGGLQGFRPGQVLALRMMCLKGSFRTFLHGYKKSVEVAGQVSAQLDGRTPAHPLSAHQMAWTVSPDDSEDGDPDRFVDEYGRIWRRTATSEWPRR